MNWKIVGEDGHVIERSFTFTVNVPEQAAETPGPTSQQTKPSEAEPTPAGGQKPVQTAPVQTPSNDKNMFIWVGVGALVLIGVVGLMMRRRK